MNKYTKKKKSSVKKPTKTPLDIVKLSSYLNLAIVIRTLHQVYGWRSKRIAQFIEAYLALMQEVADHRVTVTGAIADCKKLTGIDVIELMDSLYIER